MIGKRLAHDAAEHLRALHELALPPLALAEARQDDRRVVKLFGAFELVHRLVALARLRELDALDRERTGSGDVRGARLVALSQRVRSRQRTRTEAEHCPGS